MVTQETRVPLDDRESVRAVINRPEDCRPGVTPGVVLAHGANNDLDHVLLRAVAEGLAGQGLASVIRFNFRYSERGVKSPDRQEVLELAFRRAHDTLVDDRVCPPGPVIMGGKSLGARVAAALVSRRHEGEGLLADGLVFLGYPLHPPGNKEKLRTEPLARLDVPTLFVQGSRDPFCDLSLLRDALQELDHPPVLHVIENGGHSFEVPSSDDRSEREIHQEILGQVARFIERVTA